MQDKETRDAIKAIQNVIHEKCRALGPESYMEVLENIGAGIDGSIDALKEENPELFN